VYQLNADALRPVHDWVIGFEQLWESQLKNIKRAAEAKEAARAAKPN
jgi:hypothetical protein